MKRTPVFFALSEEDARAGRIVEHTTGFPGTWVVPGGHVDLGESPDVAALRELSEEVGLTLHQSRQSPLRLLGVYESVFPSLLEWGPPSRMHALLYYHLRLSNTDEDSFDLATTRCSVGEVGAMAWVPVHIVRHLLCRFFSSDDATGSAPPLPAAKEEEEEEVVHGVSIDPESGAATPDTFSVSGSLVPDLHNRKERVTTGTLFALREWLTSCSD